MATQVLFVWHELLTSDVAAQAFYASVIGWRRQYEPMPQGPYTRFFTGEVAVAGMMRMPADAAAAGLQPFWALASASIRSTRAPDACSGRVAR